MKPTESLSPKAQLNIKRKALKEQYQETQFKFRKTLAVIYAKSAKNTEHKFNHLYKILYQKDLLIHAMGQVMKNKGATTQGVDEACSDRANLELINKMSDDLKNNKYQFKPIKRIFIDKTNNDPNLNLKLIDIAKQGKLTKEKIKEMKARPLGIPTFKDRILQEAMYLILNSIYEPEFAQVNSNFGFRPGIGTHDAMKEIQTKVHAMGVALEADIQGAFDNVDHDILINILSERIRDQRFLKLIKQGLECGMYYGGVLEQTKIGTTQGSLISPLLYNVYANKFDKYMKNEFPKEIEEINITEKRIHRPYTRKYLTNKKLKEKNQIAKKTQKLKETYLTFGKNSLEFKKVQIEYKTAKEKFKLLDKEQKKYAALAKHRQTIRFFYIRYADDWVLFTNATPERAEQFREIFKYKIYEMLKLELSLEKTKITNMANKELAHFLGYQLTYSKNPRIKKVGFKTSKQTDLILRRKRKVEVIPTSERKRIFKQRRPKALIISWDRSRVLNKLEQARFIKKENNNRIGSAKTEWIHLQAFEIVMRYNYMIRGYADFYGPITHYSTDMHQLHYLLTYSCYHTLARKYSCSIQKVKKKFGKEILVQWSEKATYRKRDEADTIVEKEKAVKLLNWNETESIIQKRKQEMLKKISKKAKLTPESILYKSVDEIAHLKVNWRTKYKLEATYCPICGSNLRIEMHHVRHVRKVKVTGFLQVMKNLNRRQVPMCFNCHRNVHKGTYDNISLRDIYDEELIII